MTGKIAIRISHPDKKYKLGGSRRSRITRFAMR